MANTVLQLCCFDRAPESAPGENVFLLTPTVEYAGPRRECVEWTKGIKKFITDGPPRPLEVRGRAPAGVWAELGAALGVGWPNVTVGGARVPDADHAGRALALPQMGHTFLFIGKGQDSLDLADVEACKRSLKHEGADAENLSVVSANIAGVLKTPEDWTDAFQDVAATVEGLNRHADPGSVLVVQTSAPVCLMIVAGRRLRASVRRFAHVFFVEKRTGQDPILYRLEH